MTGESAAGAGRRGCIVAALDGSSAGELALPHAVAQARAFGAELLLLRVVPGATVLPEAALLPAGGTALAPGPGAIDAAGLADEEAEAGVYLDGVIAKLDAPGLRVRRRVAAGPVAPTIAAEAAACGAAVLVLAGRGRGGLARLVLGSVAEEVLRSAPCPVLLVPVPAEPAAEGPPAAVPGGVLSFEEDAQAAGAVAPKPLGLRTVDVDRIVGSVGRARELGPDFRPPQRSQRRVDDQRFMNIVRALQRGEVLPPIELYKLGYYYYVLDGNHRVAAAKLTRQHDIDAVVTEFVPVSDEESARVFNERRDFERETGLTRIGASRVGHYPRLLELIRAYAADPANRPSGYAAWTGEGLREPARSWYYRVYEPAAQALRLARLARCFPSERTADIFVHLANFRDEEAARSGQCPSWEEALRRFTDQYAACAGNVWRRVPGLRKLLRPRIKATAGAG